MELVHFRKDERWHYLLPIKSQGRPRLRPCRECEDKEVDIRVVCYAVAADMGVQPPQRYAVPGKAYLHGTTAPVKHDRAKYPGHNMRSASWHADAWLCSSTRLLEH